MAVVGFQVIKSAVNESVANKFTCIVIFSGGPLPFDASIRFYTQDGTAEGKMCINHCGCQIDQWSDKLARRPLFQACI